MKKVIVCLCIMLSMFSLAACNEGKVSKNIEITIGESSRFSDDEINDAVECVKDNFNIKGCTLTKIWYDEEKSNRIVKDYLKYGRGSINGVKAKDVIVLLSNFDVGKFGAEMALEPDSTYTDFQWTLIRDDVISEWRIDESGY